MGINLWITVDKLLKRPYFDTIAVKEAVFGHLSFVE